jgi:hypothetical protein
MGQYREAAAAVLAVLTLFACSAPASAEDSTVSFLPSATPTKFSNVSTDSALTAVALTSSCVRLLQLQRPCDDLWLWSTVQATNQKNLTTWAVKSTFTERFKSVQSCLPLSLTFATANNASIRSYQFSVNTTDLECVYDSVAPRSMCCSTASTVRRHWSTLHGSCNSSTKHVHGAPCCGGLLSASAPCRAGSRTICTRM